MRMHVYEYEAIRSKTIHKYYNTYENVAECSSIGIPHGFVAHGLVNVAPTMVVAHGLVNGAPTNEVECRMSCVSGLYNLVL